MKTKAENKMRIIKDEKFAQKSTIVFGLLCVLLFYPPFFRGLFFQKEILMTHIITFSLFSIYLLKKVLDGDKIVIDRPFDLLGLAFIIAYILPIITFQWANLREAVGHVLRYINYFVIYLMVKDYAIQKKYKFIIIDILILSGVVVALIGILAIAGYVNYQDAVLGNRISSTFQYPNTLAAFLMTLFFITATMQTIETKLWKKNAYAASGFIMLFTFIYTYSRGAWLLFPIFALLYVLVIRGEDRVSVVLYLIAAGVSNLAILRPYMGQTAVVSDKNIKVVGVVFLGLILFTALYNTTQWILKKLQVHQLKLKLVYGFVSITFVAVIGFSIYAFNVIEPLTFDNTNTTENRLNSVSRTIRDVEPSTDYIVKTNVEGYSEVENQWPWRIRITGFNKDGQGTLLSEVIGSDDNSGDIEIPWTTLEDTEYINISFSNLYPNTKVVFNNAFVYSRSDGSLIQDINLSYKYLPESIVNRFSSIGINDNSSSARLTYYKDSFEIFKNNPIVGAGGGAWNSLYPMYQTELYHSTEAHNYFLQTLVESGSIGLTLLILLIISFLVLAFKSIRKKDTLNITLIVAILSLLTHSILDFNFSYLSIPIFLWVLIALLDSDEFASLKHLTFNRKMPTTLILAAIIPLVLVSFSLYGGNQSANQAVSKINSGDIQGGVAKFEHAIRRDRFNSALRNDYANILISVAQSSGQEQLLHLAEEQLLKSEKYENNNTYTAEILSRLYLQTGEIEAAIKYSDKVIEMAPRRQYGYDFKSSIFMSLGDFYVKEGDETKALEMYENTVAVIDDMNNANESVEKPTVLANETIDRINRAKYFISNSSNKEILENIDKVAFVSYLDIDVDYNNIPDEWRTWQSTEANLTTEISPKGLSISNTGTDLGIIYTPNFSLEPNKVYRLEFEVDGNLEKNFIFARVLSRNGTSNQFAQKVITKQDNNKYSFTFKTKGDIEPEGQYIRFDHLGNTDESFVINKVILYAEE